MTANDQPTPRPRMWHFRNLDDAYTEVQCNDRIKDGDVIVCNSPDTGVTTGFVYYRAWIATVACEQTTSKWEVGNLPAIYAESEIYKASGELATLTYRRLIARRERERAEHRFAADPSDANLRALTELAGHEVSLTRDGMVGGAVASFRQARDAYYAALRAACALVIADQRGQRAPEDRECDAIYLLAEARWVTSADPACADDPTTAAYLAVCDADEDDLKAIGFDLARL